MGCVPPGGGGGGSCLEAVRKAMTNFGQIVGLLTNQQRPLPNTCKTELQPLMFQNKSRINIIFTLATTLLLPYMSYFQKT
jgi:hypothetical protein